MFKRNSNLIPRKSLNARRVEETLDDFNRPINIGYVTFTAEMCTIQPLSGDDVLVLGEGFRDKSVYNVRTNTLISAGSEASNRKPDEIEIYGKWYRVIRVQVHLVGIIPHYECICVEKDTGLI